MTDSSLTVAADLVAKCIAKSTWGGTYVPVAVATKAWPSDQRDLVPEALRILDRRGLLQWHKNGTCYGLDPSKAAEAFSFALDHASPKRAALVRERIKQPKVASAEPGEQVWTEDDDDSLPSFDPRDYVSRNEHRAALAQLREEMHRAAIRDGGTMNGDLQALRLKVAEQADTLGRLRTEAAESKAAVAEWLLRLKELDKEREMFLTLAEQVNAFLEKEQKRDQTNKELVGRDCFCDQPATALVPEFVVQGNRWKKNGRKGLCAFHRSSEYILHFRARDRPLLKRLLQTVPMKGPPFVYGDERTCLEASAILRQMGHIPKDAAVLQSLGHLPDKAELADALRKKFGDAVRLEGNILLDADDGDDEHPTCPHGVCLSCMPKGCGYGCAPEE